MFVVSSAFTIVAATRSLGRVVGVICIAVFAVYLISIGYVIYKGFLSAPEDSDSDSDSDSDDDAPSVEDSTAVPNNESTEETALLASTSRTPGYKHTLQYHFIYLILGFVALSISGFVLSHSAASIATASGVSDTVIGVTILSFATTLPEKFVAVMSGSRGHGGIVVASTAGSNIFLLTLCLGVALIAGDSTELAKSLTLFEVLMTWVSSALFLLVVLTGSGRWKGALLFVLYVVFIVLEFTVFRR